MREYKKDLYYPNVEEQEQLLEVDEETGATSLHTSSHAAASAAASAAAANDAWQDNSSSRIRQVRSAISCLLTYRRLSLLINLNVCASIRNSLGWVYAHCSSLAFSSFKQPAASLVLLLL
jgi:hypothetical protein